MAEHPHNLTVLHLVKTSIGAKWALNQMRELVQYGIKVHVALPSGGKLVNEYVEAGITVHPLQVDFPTRRLYQLPKIITKFRALVTEVEPDIIHSHFVGTTLTMRLALGKHHPTPRLFQVPGPLHLEHGIFRQAELLSAGTSDSWIGSCQWTCQRYQQSQIAKERIFLSYYGSNLKQFSQQPVGKLRQELGIDQRTKIIGMVAFMYAPKRFLGQSRGLKGHEDLIDAIALCLKQEPNLVCVMIGGAWNHADAYEQQIRAYAKSQCGDHVIFLGTRSDVPSLYADFDVVVHPSHSENVGGAAESLLLAVPTIATDVGGFPDLVKPNETGWLVPAKNSLKLSEAILDAVRGSTRAGAMAREGQQLAQQLFDVQNSTQTILNIYQAVLRRPYLPIMHK